MPRHQALGPQIGVVIATSHFLVDAVDWNKKIALLSVRRAEEHLHILRACGGVGGVRVNVGALVKLVVLVGLLMNPSSRLMAEARLGFMSPGGSVLYVSW